MLRSKKTVETHGELVPQDPGAVIDVLGNILRARLSPALQGAGLSENAIIAATNVEAAGRLTKVGDIFKDTGFEVAVSTDAILIRIPNRPQQTIVGIERPKKQTTKNLDIGKERKNSGKNHLTNLELAALIVAARLTGDEEDEKATLSKKLAFEKIRSQAHDPKNDFAFLSDTLDGTNASRLSAAWNVVKKKLEAVCSRTLEMDFETATINKIALKAIDADSNKIDAKLAIVLRKIADTKFSDLTLEAFFEETRDISRKKK